VIQYTAKDRLVLGVGYTATRDLNSFLRYSAKDDNGPGTAHGGGRGGFRAAAARSPNGCALPTNPNPESDTMNALRVAMAEWISKGVEPPPSRYPTLAQGQLAPATRSAIGFPNIPGVPSPEGLVNPVNDFDFGPEFKYNDLSGAITKNPPAIKQTLPTLVPKVDADGSDVGGVPSVLRQAPLGYIPFAKTKAERTANHDPRLSLEERYGTHTAYVDAVK
jgi:hypothetical protein